ncbi:hypothetical protein C8F01DRAFT_1106317 [Mycena amicta]|nr:hypothetical protein C8F01DRAFT_1106317 [Mycena amicta]
MPKRIPTPEPGDDEPKYYTVVQPYPLNANWELPHDYITCGRWVASCIGSPDPLFALFYKPSARGQVLLEVNRDYVSPERLLGEHRWSEFLRKPTAEEAGRVTQIFYSTYSNGRAAQKDGWKRINVADSWFKNWSPENPVISHPYPPTQWCPLPPEDKTNKPMCRPLPVALKPPPQKASAPPPVVPGSSAWHNKKTAEPTHTPAILRGAWAAKQAGMGRGAAQPKTVKAIPATSTAPWHNPTAPKGNNVAVPLPPGLDTPALSGRSTSTASTHSTGSQYDALTTQMGTISMSMSPSQEACLYGPEGDIVAADPNAYVAEWEKAAIIALSDVSAPEPEQDGANLWGEEDDIEQKKKKTQEILCTVHGIICKKGICQEYARLLRMVEGGKTKSANNGSGKAKTTGSTKNGNGWNKHTWDDEEGGRGRGPAKSKSASGNNNGGWTSVRGGR